MQRLSKGKKIGLLGGTFDPVHNGHLAVANHVRQTLALDSVWFIPASQPPHKSGHGDGREITVFSQRLAMLERAIRPYPAFAVSDIEAKRTAPSYSIDTLNILVQQTDPGVDLYFVIGADAFIEIDTWKRFRELPDLVSFVIITRPGFPPGKVETVIRRTFPAYEYDPVRKSWQASNHPGAFILLHMEPVPISSTLVRERVRGGKDISGLVPPAVEAYIKKMGLYSK
jgi:nicotinate-nucleotide adenylyltransferase